MEPPDDTGSRHSSLICSCCFTSHGFSYVKTLYISTASLHAPADNCLSEQEDSLICPLPKRAPPAFVPTLAPLPLLPQRRGATPPLACPLEPIPSLRAIALISISVNKRSKHLCHRLPQYRIHIPQLSPQNYPVRKVCSLFYT